MGAKDLNIEFTDGEEEEIKEEIEQEIDLFFDGDSSSDVEAPAPPNSMSSASNDVEDANNSFAHKGNPAVASKQEEATQPSYDIPEEFYQDNQEQESEILDFPSNNIEPFAVAGSGDKVHSEEDKTLIDNAFEKLSNSPSPQPLAPQSQELPAKGFAFTSAAQPQAQARPKMQTHQQLKPAQQFNPEYAGHILSDQVSKSNVDAAVANATVEFMAERLSEAKLLEFKINQLLGRIEIKSSEFANEIEVIKMMLAEHSQFKK